MQGNPLSQVGKVFSLFMSGKETLPLRSGEIVTAEVLTVGSNSDAMVRLKNAAVEVHTDVPLQKGEMLTLRVEREEDAIYLWLAGNTAEQQVGSVSGTILAALDSFEGLKNGSEGMARLVSLLAKLPESLKQNLPEIDIINCFLLQIDRLSGKTMKDVVQNGGIFFETKLRILALGLEAEGAPADIEAGRIIANDLKASLLRLKDIFLVPDVLERLRSSVNPDEIFSALNRVLRNIEFYQLQSKLTDSLQFFLPLVWRELKDGEIIVREFDRGEPGERSYSCTLNLDLDHTGKLRVILVYQAGRVHVTCAVENSGFSKLLQEGADALEQQLRSSGLRLGHLAVHHEPKIQFQRNPPDERLSIRV